MKELIERLEKATGPDRVLDYDIAMHINRPFGAWDSFQEYDAAFPTYTRRDAPSFTSSLDAALTLVPEGWTRAVDATVPEDGIDVDLFPDTGLVRGSHTSEAIATCIAALKARATTSVE